MQKKKWMIWKIRYGQKLVDSAFWLGMAACMLAPVLVILTQHKGWIALGAAGLCALGWALKKM